MTAYSSASMTEARAVQPGVHLAKVFVPEGIVHTKARIIDLTEETVKLMQDQLLRRTSFSRRRRRIDAVTW